MQNLQMAVRFSAWSGSALLSLLIAAHLCQGAPPAEILVHPRSQSAPFDIIATFSCKAKGEYFVWKINDTVVPENRENDPSSELSRRGLMFVRNISSSDEYDIATLQVSIPATTQNDNTQVQCRATLLAHSNTLVESDSAVFTIMSPPTPFLLVISPTVLQIHWKTSIDVLNYKLIVQDSSSHTLQNCTINAVCNVAISCTLMDDISGSSLITNVSVGCNETSIAFQLSTGGKVAETCTELNFNVEAINDLGNTEPTTLSGGFPIAPPSFTTPVNHSVYYRSDGSPVVEIQFMLPPVCTFQYPAEYTTTVENLNLTTNNTFMLGPVSVSSADCERLMEEDITEGLMIDTMYSVTVTMYTVAGSSNATSYFIVLGTAWLCLRGCGCPLLLCTDFNPTEAYTSEGTESPDRHSATGTEVDPTEAYISDSTDLYSATATDFTPTETSFTDIKYRDVGVEIMVVAAAASVIALSILCVCIILACLFWRKKSLAQDQDKSAKKAQTAMIPNPIYEGPLYESITQQFSTLTASVEARESRYLDNPVNPTTREDFVDAKMDGVIECRVSRALSLKSDDNYTVMSPVTTVAPFGMSGKEKEQDGTADC